MSLPTKILRLTAAPAMGLMASVPAFAQAAAGNAAHVDAAVDAAQRAFSGWSKTPDGERQALLHEAQGATGASAVHGMDWHEFEMLVGEAFRQHGYTVTETGASGPDGGVDLVLTKGGERFLVQCKQWRALKVGVSVVREHYGVMAAQGAAGGFVVTSGRFTKEAEAFASGRHIYLIDGPQLQEMIRIGRVHAPTPAPVQVATIEVSPSCPLCQSSMVTRTAKKGANAGSQFWGCSKYPDCRGTRQT